MTVAVQLPPVTLETLDGYPVMRWMDMQAWAGNFEDMQWVHLLIDAYVDSYGHYFTVNGDITMLLDPALWEKFRISMASQPGTLVPAESCTINGVTIKPYMSHEAAPVSRSGHLYQLQTASRDGVLMVDTSGGYGIVPVTPIPMVEIEKSEHERLLAVERAYNILCEQSRAGQ